MIRNRVNLPEALMLHSLRLRNLINTYCEIISFMLSFYIPNEQKSISLATTSEKITPLQMNNLNLECPIS